MRAAPSLPVGQDTYAVAYAGQDTYAGRAEHVCGASPESACRAGHVCGGIRTLDTKEYLKTHIESKLLVCEALGYPCMRP